MSRFFSRSSKASPHDDDPPYDSFKSDSRDPKRPHQEFAVKMSKKEWEDKLGEDFGVLRRGHTERAFTSYLDKHYPEHGVYKCKGCDAPLYKASHKFNSGCGWPAFFDAFPNAVKRHPTQTAPNTHEIWCNSCGAHLGHVFLNEGFKNPTNERHCVNGVTLNFDEADQPEAVAGSKV